MLYWSKNQSLLDLGALPTSSLLCSTGTTLCSLLEARQQTIVQQAQTTGEFVSGWTHPYLSVSGGH